MTNLSDACKMCKDNGKGHMYCCEVCGVPTAILERVENDRNQRDEILDIVKNSPSEDLIQNLYKWLDENTTIVK